MGRAVALALASALPLLLAACQRAPSADDPLFPLAEGRRWEYQETTRFEDDGEPERRERLVLVSMGPQPIDGEPAWRRRSDAGIDYWLRTDASGTYRVASRHPLQREPQPDDPRRYVLPRPHAVGTAWSVPTTTYVLQRRNEVPREIRHTHKPVEMRYRVEALDETLSVPAGRFSGCLRAAGQAQVRLYVDAMFAWREVPLATREWYCPGVGLVKLERLEPSPSRFLQGGTVTLELVSWQ